MHKPSLKGASAALAGLLLLALTAGRASSATALDQGVLDEVNFARTHPSDYAQELLRDAAADRLSPASFAYQDPAALAEAVDFLKRQPALAPLQPDAKLAETAIAYAAAQGREGGFGHVGPDGSTLRDRLHQHGVWPSSAAEDISYGYRTPREVVRQLIIDAGVPDRGHRANIFGAAYQTAGVSCADHRVWRALCVIDFAGPPMRASSGKAAQPAG